MSSPATYPVATVAKLLVITPRWLQQLTKEGHLPRPAARGRYELVPTVQAYVKFLRDRAISESDAGGEANDRIRLVKAKADIAEIEAQRLRGELLSREDVSAAVHAAFARVRARMIGLPTKVAPLVSVAHEPAECEGLIRRAVHDALRELSETAVADLCGFDGGVVEDAGAAAGPDGESVGGREAAAEPRSKRRARKMGHQPG